MNDPRLATNSPHTAHIFGNDELEEVCISGKSCRTDVGLSSLSTLEAHSDH
jgi:hypothetical protein